MIRRWKFDSGCAMRAFHALDRRGIYVSDGRRKVLVDPHTRFAGSATSALASLGRPILERPDEMHASLGYAELVDSGDRGLCIADTFRLAVRTKRRAVRALAA